MFWKIYFSMYNIVYVCKWQWYWHQNYCCVQCKEKLNCSFLGDILTSWYTDWDCAIYDHSADSAHSSCSCKSHALPKNSTDLPPPALKIGLISSAVGIFWTIYLSPKKWLNWNEDEDPKFQSSVCGEEGWQIFWLKSKVGIFIAPAPHFFGPVIFLFIWYIPTDGPIKEVSCFVGGGKSECFDGRLIQSELPPPPLMTLSHLAQDSGWQRCCPKYPGRCQKGWKTNVATGQEGSVVQTTVYAARLDFWGSFYAAAKP